MAAKLSPVDYVKQFNEQAAEAFQALRKAAVAGPLDESTYELIVIATLAATGEEGSFKVHARRLLNLNVSIEAVRQAVLTTLGASTTFSQVVSALHWIEAVYGTEQ